MMVLEYGHLLRHNFDDNKADEDAEKSPRSHDQVTDGLERLFSMAEKIGDRIRQYSPWRTRHPGI